jgi:hypothetical protein
MKRGASILSLVIILFASSQILSQNLSVIAGFGGGGLSGTGAIPIGVGYEFYKVNENIVAGAFAAFASTSEDISAGFGMSGKWSYTNIIVAAQANYYFSPGNTFDPFAGLSLGYNVASASWEWDNKPNFPGLTEPSATAGGFFYSAQIGFNYWLSKGMALQVRAGYFPYIAAGINFKL